eukprot:Gb_41558 [translate_table: standard]
MTELMIDRGSPMTNMELSLAEVLQGFGALEACVTHTQTQFAKGGEPLQGPLELDCGPRRTMLGHREDSEEEFQARLSRMEENMESRESSKAGTSQGHPKEDKEEPSKSQSFGMGKASHSFTPFKRRTGTLSDIRRRGREGIILTTVRDKQIHLTIEKSETDNISDGHDRRRLTDRHRDKREKRSRRKGYRAKF